MNQATIIDLGACIGCEACALACRAEHDTPLGPSRLQLRTVEQGAFPAPRRQHALSRCLHCEQAPCSAICPTGALWRRSDGLVALDAERCLGCRACVAACPYDAIAIQPETGLADKCDGCAARVDEGRAPACALACPTGAIQAGDLDDPRDPLAARWGEAGLLTRRAGLGTRPRLRFRGDYPDPLAGAAPGLQARAEAPEGASPLLATPTGPGLNLREGPRRAGLDARAALLSWTQGLAAGVFLVPAVGVLLGLLPADSLIHRIIAPLIGLLYLVGTAAAAAWSTGRRGRLGLLIRYPNMSSWLTRGALLSLGLGAVLGLQLAATLLGLPLHGLLLLPGLLLALAVPAALPLALRQCSGRALWRARSGVARGVASAITTGGAMLLPFVGALAPEQEAALAGITALGALGWLVAVGRDLRVPAEGAEARAAALELSRGAWRGPAWGGVVLTLLGLLAPFAGAWITLPVLAGPLLYGHALIGAGQSVPQS